MRLPDNELEALLLGGESHRVERKESLGGNSKEAVAEAICAFANDLAGDGEPGVIFVGVKDKANEASGFNPDENALQTLMNMKTDGRITPPPSILVESRTVAGVAMAVVTVLPSPSPPVRFNGRIHVRIGARRGIATAQDEGALNEKRRHHDTFYDIHPLRGVKMETLSMRRFEEDYLPSAFPESVLEANNRSLTQQLASTRMIVSAEDTTPTILGMMVLGRKPLFYLPNFYIQFLRIDGTEWSDTIADAAEMDGTLSDILERMDDKLRAHINVSVDITSADKEIRRATYPLTALQELTRNAVMHRSYEGTNAPIRVTWFNDRIEIQNPGGPYGQVTRENFGTPGVIDYRNPNLADAMKALGFVQRFGVGISTARDALAREGNPPLEFAVHDTHIAVTVRGRSTT